MQVPVAGSYGISSSLLRYKQQALKVLAAGSQGIRSSCMQVLVMALRVSSHSRLSKMPESKPPDACGTRSRL